MRYFLLIIILLSFLMTSCSSSKEVFVIENGVISKTDKIIANAKSFKGTKYKFGGITKKGMDCSGLIYTAFKKENIQLPRVSRFIAEEGSKIPLHKAKKGDLLFFRTNGNSRKINHVGLITSIKNKQIHFIHATTSRGVIISLLSEKYWKNAFVKAVTVL